MSIIIECDQCKHWIINKERPKCRAFPKGIPFEIIAGEFDHRNPHPDDNGIRYEQKEDNR